MSTDRDTATADAPDIEDPYGIVPDDFMSHYPQADTISEALRIAEQAASETDPEEFERCPSCLSIRLRQKPGTDAMPHKRQGDKKCTGCNEHFSDPLPPLVEARRDAAHAPTTERAAERPRCRACLSTDLYPVPERAAAVDARWVCLDCTARFDDALPSYNAVLRGEATQAEREAIGEAFRESDGEWEWASLTERAQERRESYGPSEQATLREVMRR